MRDTDIQKKTYEEKTTILVKSRNPAIKLAIRKEPLAMAEAETWQKERHGGDKCPTCGARKKRGSIAAERPTWRFMRYSRN